MKRFNHIRLIKNRLMSIYLFGAYCAVEVDIYPFSVAIQLWCKGQLSDSFKLINILRT
jgi:hypothetical protein